MDIKAGGAGWLLCKSNRERDRDRTRDILLKIYITQFLSLKCAYTVQRTPSSMWKLRANFDAISSICACVFFCLLLFGDLNVYTFLFCRNAFQCKWVSRSTFGEIRQFKILAKCVFVALCAHWIVLCFVCVSFYRHFFPFLAWKMLWKSDKTWETSWLTFGWRKVKFFYLFGKRLEGLPAQQWLSDEPRTKAAEATTATTEGKNVY